MIKTTITIAAPLILLLDITILIKPSSLDLTMQCIPKCHIPMRFPMCVLHVLDQCLHANVLLQTAQGSLA